MITNQPPPLDRRQTVLILSAFLTATFITAIDLTIVGTAMPTIVGQLGGLELFSWAFTSYLLTSTTSVPLYGKLADLYGRLPVFTVGVAIFLLGSALCGGAQTMEQLIAFRAVQGLGAGAIQPVVITMVGDVFSVEQRARFTALFSSVWGVASVAGPAVGGVITDAISWRWVFFLNVPICIAALAMLWRFFPERVERRKHELDFLGAGLLTLAITALLLATSARSTAIRLPPPLGDAGDDVLMGALLAISASLFTLFVFVERRATEPVFPLHLFTMRVISVTALVLILVGGLQFATSTYVPLLVQGVFGSTAAGAGAMLIPQSIGWPIGSWLGGRMIMRFGFRPTLLLGLAAILAGSAPFVLVTEAISLFWVGLIVGIQGFGLGLTTLSTMIAAQNAVDWGQRGATTGVVMLARSMGASLGVTVLGALLAYTFAQASAEINLAAFNVREAAALLDPTVRAGIPPTILSALQSALAAAMAPVWWGIALLAAGALALGVLFPRVRAS